MMRNKDITTISFGILGIFLGLYLNYKINQIELFGGSIQVNIIIYTLYKMFNKEVACGIFIIFGLLMIVGGINSHYKNQRKYYKKLKKNSFEYLQFNDLIKYLTKIELSEKMLGSLRASNLKIFINQFYLHNSLDDLTFVDEKGEDWYNQAIYFWDKEEYIFNNDMESKQHKMFFFNPNLGDISLNIETETNNKKYYCELDGKKILIKDLISDGLIEYIKIIKLEDNNLEILKNNEEYFFIMNKKIIDYRDNKYSLDNIEITLATAFAIGGIEIAKKSN